MVTVSLSVYSMVTLSVQCVVAFKLLGLGLPPFASEEQWMPCELFECSTMYLCWRFSSRSEAAVWGEHVCPLLCAVTSESVE